MDCQRLVLHSKLAIHLSSIWIELSSEKIVFRRENEKYHLTVSVSTDDGVGGRHGGNTIVDPNCCSDL